MYGVRIIVTLLLGFLATAAHADEIRLRADPYYPYNGEPANEHPGYMVELAKAIFEPLGHTVDYQLMPWARAIREAEAGRIEGLVCAGRAEVPHFVFPEEPQGILRDAVFTLKESTWKYSGVDSLKSLLLGYIADYSYGPTFDNYITTHKKDSALLHANTGDDALLQNLEMLKRGRITALVSNPEVFYATLRKHGIPTEQFRLAVLGPDLDPAYIAFAPKHPKAQQYAKILSDGTRKLRETGELQRILTRYGISDWKGQ